MSAGNLPVMSRSQPVIDGNYCNLVARCGAGNGFSVKKSVGGCLSCDVIVP